MKFISWNVNGLRAAVGKGFIEVVQDLNADFFSVQETKLQAGQIDLCLDGYTDYWSYAEKKGYSGVATFCRKEIIGVTEGIGLPSHDTEGRALTLETDRFYLVNVYVPNSQGDLRRIDFRMEWDARLRDYLMELDTKKPVILCGDLNVAHHEIDLKHPERNIGSAGFSDQERQGFDNLLSAGFVDTFRYLHPDAEGMYTWWSYMMRSRQRNDGWRIDYFIVSQRIAPLLQAAEIHPSILGSDHCPVSITLDI